MSNTIQNDATGSVDHQIQTKLTELAELISMQQYGSDGPPQNLTFRKIEQAGYEAAQLAAAKFETTVTDLQQRHFNGPQQCPGCPSSRL